MAESRRDPSHPLNEGFSELYRARSRELLIFFARRTYDAEIAFDLVAETFAQALLSRRKFHGTSQEDAAAWIYGIARHQLAEYFRKGKVEARALRRLSVSVPCASVEELDRVEELADLQALRATTAAALRQLATDQQQALELRIVQELPYQEVAERLGVTESTARARVSRGLRALAQHLEGAMPQEEPT